MVLQAAEPADRERTSSGGGWQAGPGNESTGDPQGAGSGPSPLGSRNGLHAGHLPQPAVSDLPQGPDASWDLVLQATLHAYADRLAAALDSGPPSRRPPKPLLVTEP
jgi:hypothetical protein